MAIEDIDIVTAYYKEQEAIDEITFATPSNESFALVDIGKIASCFMFAHYGHFNVTSWKIEKLRDTEVWSKINKALAEL